MFLKGWLTGLSSHSISTISSYGMSEVPLSPGCLRSTPKLLLLKRRENLELGSKFFYGVCSIQHQTRNFPSQVHSQKTCTPFGSFKSQLFTGLRWAEDFEGKGLYSRPYKHNGSQETLLLSQWTGSIFQSSHKLESSSSGTVFPRQYAAIRVELGCFFPLLPLYSGEPLTCSGPELPHLRNGTWFPVL